MWVEEHVEPSAGHGLRRAEYDLANRACSS